MITDLDSIDLDTEEFIGEVVVDSKHVSVIDLLIDR